MSSISSLRKGPLDGLLAEAGRVILGKDEALRLALTCLLAGGHLLIEDLPGVGKTTLAHTLAALLGLDFRRLQFTADLLPADILGASVYEPGRGEFRFHPGPVFAQVLLADEVNRATPRAQSALLEAMEEGQVSVDGVSHPLPEPFFVIATQNPREQVGTFPLPESQLDRFLMRLSLGYPDAGAERALLRGEDRRELLARLNPRVDPAQLRGWAEEIHAVHVADVVLDYLLALLAASREHPAIDHGLSPRAGLAWLRAARAWAWLAGRETLRPDDLQRLAVPVLAHRLAPVHLAGPVTGAELVRRLLEGIPAP
jgi:MoxR-like ATPase